MSNPSFVYVTYIRATPDKVWEALTKADLTEKYWFGYRVLAQAGRLHDGRKPFRHAGPPRSDTGKRSAAASRVQLKPLYKDIPNERPSRVTFVVEASKGQTKLTVTHDEFEEGSRIFGMIRNGWPAVLSSLKSFLETGQGLEPSWDDDERKRAAQA
ncbi:MAG: SRPBCC domain-containing protein [Pseudolabrys sp.]